MAVVAYIKFVDQETEPTLGKNKAVLWLKTSTGQLFFIYKTKDGVQKFVELG